MKRLIAENDYYKVEVDKVKNRMYSVYRGFWEKPSDIPNYLEDVESAIGMLTSGFTTIVDLREMKTPSPDVTELIIKMQKFSIDAGFSRGARVMDTAMVTITTGRVTRESEAEEQVRMFGSWEEAEEWLDSLG